MSLPDLESLRCFEAAASLLSFRAAARRVALSPPAFSDRISRLEELLGARLFERTTRQVALTPAGASLLVQARKVLEEAARCVEAVRQEPEAAPFELEVGTRYELGLSWLTPALSVLARSCPQRTLHLYFGDSADLLQRVREGKLDCAVTSARLTSAWVRYSVLHEERYVFVASPRLLKRAPLKGAGDAAGHALLDLHRDLPLFRYFLDACPPGQVWGFGRNELLGTIAVVRHRVMEGAGVAVLPEYFVRDDLARRRLVALCPRIKPQRDFFRLVWRQGNAREEQLEALAAEMRALPLR